LGDKTHEDGVIGFQTRVSNFAREEGRRNVKREGGRDNGRGY
jgi:hypothetical protein